MRVANNVWGLLVVLLAVPVARGADSKPAEALAGLKKECNAALEELQRAFRPPASEAEWSQARDRYFRQAVSLARRALVLAEAYPDAPEATQALVWVFLRGPGAYSARTDAECDAAYDLMARRYLDRDAILPICRSAWHNASRTVHAEAFLRAALERSPNLKVRASACLSLGRHQQYLAREVQELHHPVRGKECEEWLGPENARRIRALNPEDLRRQAEALYERTIKEFGNVRPSDGSSTLGKQAEGALFEVRNLEIGCTIPDIEGEDLDGKPMRLSEFRGRVVVLSFWAGWCGPCMRMVAGEKTLVERMKGRPFILIGVNGDPSRAAAKSVADKHGINWRSFWDGGARSGIASKWGVHLWPTIHLVDAKGVIRDRFNGDNLESAAEALVAETESARKP